MEPEAASPARLIPFDVASGMMQEAMRNALADYGILASTAAFLVDDANRRLGDLLGALDELE